jgi:hypothetical protein
MSMTASWFRSIGIYRIQDAMGVCGETAKLVASINGQLTGSSLMQKRHTDDSKACLTAFAPDKTVIAVIEMSLASWVVAAMIPGVNREPLKKIAADPEVLLRLLYRWRDQAIKAGRTSPELPSHMRPSGIAFGWPAGCEIAALIPT